MALNTQIHTYSKIRPDISDDLSCSADKKEQLFICHPDDLLYRFDADGNIRLIIYFVNDLDNISTSGYLLVCDHLILLDGK